MYMSMDQKQVFCLSKLSSKVLCKLIFKIAYDRNAD